MDNNANQRPARVKLVKRVQNQSNDSDNSLGGFTPIQSPNNDNPNSIVIPQPSQHIDQSQSLGTNLSSDINTSTTTTTTTNTTVQRPKWVKKKYADDGSDLINIVPIPINTLTNNNININNGHHSAINTTQSSILLLNRNVTTTDNNADNNNNNNNTNNNNNNIDQDQTNNDSIIDPALVQTLQIPLNTPNSNLIQNLYNYSVGAAINLDTNNTNSAIQSNLSQSESEKAFLESLLTFVRKEMAQRGFVSTNNLNNNDNNNIVNSFSNEFKMCDDDESDVISNTNQNHIISTDLNDPSSLITHTHNDTNDQIHNTSITQSYQTHQSNKSENINITDFEFNLESDHDDNYNPDTVSDTFSTTLTTRIDQSNSVQYQTNEQNNIDNDTTNTTNKSINASKLQHRMSLNDLDRNNNTNTNHINNINPHNSQTLAQKLNQSTTNPITPLNFTRPPPPQLPPPQIVYDTMTTNLITKSNLYNQLNKAAIQHENATSPPSPRDNTVYETTYHRLQAILDTKPCAKCDNFIDLSKKMLMITTKDLINTGFIFTLLYKASFSPHDDRIPSQMNAIGLPFDVNLPLIPKDDTALQPKSFLASSTNTNNTTNDIVMTDNDEDNEKDKDVKYQTITNNRINYAIDIFGEKRNVYTLQNDIYNFITSPQHTSFFEIVSPDRENQPSYINKKDTFAHTGVHSDQYNGEPYPYGVDLNTDYWSQHHQISPPQRHFISPILHSGSFLGSMLLSTPLKQTQIDLLQHIPPHVTSDKPPTLPSYTTALAIEKDLSPYTNDVELSIESILQNKSLAFSTKITDLSTKFFDLGSFPVQLFAINNSKVMSFNPLSMQFNQLYDLYTNAIGDAGIQTNVPSSLPTVSTTKATTSTPTSLLTHPTHQNNTTMGITHNIDYSFQTMLSATIPLSEKVYVPYLNTRSDVKLDSTGNPEPLPDTIEQPYKLPGESDHFHLDNFNTLLQYKMYNYSIRPPGCDTGFYPYSRIQTQRTSILQCIPFDRTPLNRNFFDMDLSKLIQEIQQSTLLTDFLDTPPLSQQNHINALELQYKYTQISNNDFVKQSTLARPWLYAHHSTLLTPLDPQLHVEYTEEMNNAHLNYPNDYSSSNEHKFNDVLTHSKVSIIHPDYELYKLDTQINIFLNQILTKDPTLISALDSATSITDEEFFGYSVDAKRNQQPLPLHKLDINTGFDINDSRDEVDLQRIFDYVVWQMYFGDLNKIPYKMLYLISRLFSQTRIGQYYQAFYGEYHVSQSSPARSLDTETQRQMVLKAFHIEIPVESSIQGQFSPPVQPPLHASTINTTESNPGLNGDINATKNSSRTTNIGLWSPFIQSNNTPTTSSQCKNVPTKTITHEHPQFTDYLTFYSSAYFILVLYRFFQHRSKTPFSGPNPAKIPGFFNATVFPTITPPFISPLYDKNALDPHVNINDFSNLPLQYDPSLYQFITSKLYSRHNHNNRSDVSVLRKKYYVLTENYDMGLQFQKKQFLSKNSTLLQLSQQFSFPLPLTTYHSVSPYYSTTLANLNSYGGYLLAQHYLTKEPVVPTYFKSGRVLTAQHQAYKLALYLKEDFAITPSIVFTPMPSSALSISSDMTNYTTKTSLSSSSISQLPRLIASVDTMTDNVFYQLNNITPHRSNDLILTSNDQYNIRKLSFEHKIIETLFKSTQIMPFSTQNRYYVPSSQDTFYSHINKMSNLLYYSSLCTLTKPTEFINDTKPGPHHDMELYNINKFLRRHHTNYVLVDDPLLVNNTLNPFAIQQHNHILTYFRSLNEESQRFYNEIPQDLAVAYHMLLNRQYFISANPMPPLVNLDNLTQDITSAYDVTELDINEPIPDLDDEYDDYFNSLYASMLQEWRVSNSNYLHVKPDQIDFSDIILNPHTAHLHYSVHQSFVMSDLSKITDIRPVPHQLLNGTLTNALKILPQSLRSTVSETIIVSQSDVFRFDDPNQKLSFYQQQDLEKQFEPTVKFLNDTALWWPDSTILPYHQLPFINNAETYLSGGNPYRIEKSPTTKDFHIHNKKLPTNVESLTKSEMIGLTVAYNNAYDLSPEELIMYIGLDPIIICQKLTPEQIELRSPHHPLMKHNLDKNGKFKDPNDSANEQNNNNNNNNNNNGVFDLGTMMNNTNCATEYQCCTNLLLNTIPSHNFNRTRLKLAGYDVKEITDKKDFIPRVDDTDKDTPTSRENPTNWSMVMPSTLEYCCYRHPCGHRCMGVYGETIHSHCLACQQYNSENNKIHNELQSDNLTSLSTEIELLATSSYVKPILNQLLQDVYHSDCDDILHSIIKAEHTAMINDDAAPTINVSTRPPSELSSILQHQLSLHTHIEDVDGVFDTQLPIKLTYTDYNITNFITPLLTDDNDKPLIAQPFYDMAIEHAVIEEVINLPIFEVLQFLYTKYIVTELPFLIHYINEMVHYNQQLELQGESFFTVNHSVWLIGEKMKRAKNKSDQNHNKQSSSSRLIQFPIAPPSSIHLLNTIIHSTHHYRNLQNLHCQNSLNNINLDDNNMNIDGKNKGSNNNSTSIPNPTHPIEDNIMTTSKSDIYTALTTALFTHLSSFAHNSQFLDPINIETIPLNDNKSSSHQPILPDIKSNDTIKPSTILPPPDITEFIEKMLIPQQKWSIYHFLLFFAPQEILYILSLAAHFHALHIQAVHKDVFNTPPLPIPLTHSPTIDLLSIPTFTSPSPFNYSSHTNLHSFHSSLSLIQIIGQYPSVLSLFTTVFKADIQSYILAVFQTFTQNSIAKNALHLGKSHNGGGLTLAENIIENISKNTFSITPMYTPFVPIQASQSIFSSHNISNKTNTTNTNGIYAKNTILDGFAHWKQFQQQQDQLMNVNDTNETERFALFTTHVTNLIKFLTYMLSIGISPVLLQSIIQTNRVNQSNNQMLERNGYFKNSSIQTTPQSLLAQRIAQKSNLESLDKNTTHLYHHYRSLFMATLPTPAPINNADQLFLPIHSHKERTPSKTSNCPICFGAIVKRIKSSVHDADDDDDDDMFDPFDPFGADSDADKSNKKTSPSILTSTTPLLKLSCGCYYHNNCLLQFIVSKLHNDSPNGTINDPIAINWVHDERFEPNDDLDNIDPVAEELAIQEQVNKRPRPFPDTVKGRKDRLNAIELVRKQRENTRLLQRSYEFVNAKKPVLATTKPKTPNFNWMKCLTCSAPLLTLQNPLVYKSLVDLYKKQGYLIGEGMNQLYADNDVGINVGTLLDENKEQIEAIDTIMIDPDIDDDDDDDDEKEDDNNVKNTNMGDNDDVDNNNNNNTNKSTMLKQLETLQQSLISSISSNNSTVLSTLELDHIIFTKREQKWRKEIQSADKHTTIIFPEVNNYVQDPESIDDADGMDTEHVDDSDYESKPTTKKTTKKAPPQKRHNSVLDCDTDLEKSNTTTGTSKNKKSKPTPAKKAPNKRVATIELLDSEPDDASSIPAVLAKNTPPRRRSSRGPLPPPPSLPPSNIHDHQKSRVIGTSVQSTRSAPSSLSERIAQRRLNEKQQADAAAAVVNDLPKVNNDNTSNNQQDPTNGDKEVYCEDDNDNLSVLDASIDTVGSVDSFKSLPNSVYGTVSGSIAKTSANSYGSYEDELIGTVGKNNHGDDNDMYIENIDSNLSHSPKKQLDMNLSNSYTNVCPTSIDNNEDDMPCANSSSLTVKNRKSLPNSNTPLDERITSVRKSDQNLRQGSSKLSLVSRVHTYTSTTSRNSFIKMITTPHHSQHDPLITNTTPIHNVHINTIPSTGPYNIYYQRYHRPLSLDEYSLMFAVTLPSIDQEVLWAYHQYRLNPSQFIIDTRNIVHNWSIYGPNGVRNIAHTDKSANVAIGHILQWKSSAIHPSKKTKIDHKIAKIATMQSQIIHIYRQFHLFCAYSWAISYGYPISRSNYVPLFALKQLFSQHTPNHQVFSLTQFFTSFIAIFITQGTKSIPKLDHHFAQLHQYYASHKAILPSITPPATVIINTKDAYTQMNKIESLKNTNENEQTQHISSEDDLFSPIVDNFAPGTTTTTTSTTMTTGHNNNNTVKTHIQKSTKLTSPQQFDPTSSGLTLFEQNSELDVHLAAQSHYENNPILYSLSQFVYQICYYCQMPFANGRYQCADGQDGQGPAQDNPNELFQLPDEPPAPGDDDNNNDGDKKNAMNDDGENNNNKDDDGAAGAGDENGEKPMAKDIVFVNDQAIGLDTLHAFPWSTHTPYKIPVSFQHSSALTVSLPKKILPSVQHPIPRGKAVKGVTLFMQKISPNTNLTTTPPFPYKTCPQCNERIKKIKLLHQTALIHNKSIYALPLASSLFYTYHGDFVYNHSPTHQLMQSSPLFKLSAYSLQVPNIQLHLLQGFVNNHIPYSMTKMLLQLHAKGVNNINHGMNMNISMSANNNDELGSIYERDLTQTSFSSTSWECPTHGAQFVLWKCRFCCNISTWHCWPANNGGTRFCNSCHTLQNQLDDMTPSLHNALSLPQCRNAILYEMNLQNGSTLRDLIGMHVATEGKRLESVRYNRIRQQLLHKPRVKPANHDPHKYFNPLEPLPEEWRLKQTERTNLTNQAIQLNQQFTQYVNGTSDQLPLLHKPSLTPTKHHHVCFWEIYFHKILFPKENKDDSDTDSDGDDTKDKSSSGMTNNTKIITTSASKKKLTAAQKRKLAAASASHDKAMNQQESVLEKEIEAELSQSDTPLIMASLHPLNGTEYNFGCSLCLLEKLEKAKLLKKEKEQEEKRLKKLILATQQSAAAMDDANKSDKHDDNNHSNNNNNNDDEINPSIAHLSDLKIDMKIAHNIVEDIDDNNHCSNKGNYVDIYKLQTNNVKF